VVDITERKKAEEGLKKLEELNHTSILQTAMDGFWLLDMQGCLLEVNETYCRMSGYTAQELRSMHVSDLEAVEVDFTAHLNKVIVLGDYRFESRHRRKDGSTFDIEVSIQYQSTDDRFVTFLHDISDRKAAEENLRQSEERYKSLFQNNHSVMLLLDPETGEINDANPAASLYYGWTHSELIGKNMSEINVLTKQEVIGEMQKAKKEKRNHFFFKHRLANGEFNDVEVYTGPIKFSKSTMLYSIVHDITDQKRAEEELKHLYEELEDRVKERTAELLKSNIALQQAEEKYRTVADFTYGWEYWLDQKDNMLYCSPSCERITGFKASEFIQNPKLLFDIIHPDDANIFHCHKQKEDVAKEGHREIHYRIIHSDGSVRWLGHVCQPIFDESGNFIGNRGSNRDITDRKEMEQLLKTNNLKYKLLSENITDGIFICRNGYFEYFNKVMSHIFGFKGNELDGSTLTRLVKPDYQEELKNFLASNAPLNQNLTIEVECLKKDLSTVFVEILLNYVANQGVVYGVVHDITEKKQIQKNIVKAIIQTEEKERANFSKELHDGLGPLLSTIKLYLQWSERPKTNITHDEIIRKAEDTLEDALTAVKEISNKLSPHLLIYYGLNSAIQSFAGKVEETSSIRISFESNIERRIDMIIESALYRAIIECINNTLKHALANNITIGLHDTGNQLLLQYRDDGIGFDLNETLTLKKGLGLFNLQNRIHAIGGKLTMSGNPGKGVDYQIVVNI